jgi:hypothetical protein
VIRGLFPWLAALALIGSGAFLLTLGATSEPRINTPYVSPAPDRTAVYIHRQTVIVTDSAERAYREARTGR